MLLVVISWLLAPWILIRRRFFCQQLIRRILLIQTAKIGDVVCATPVIDAVRAAYPDAFFAVLLSSGCADLMKHNMAIDGIILTPKGGYRGLRSKIRFVRQLYRHHFDLVIGLNPSLPLWLLPVITGIPLHAVVFPPTMSRSLRWASIWIQIHQRHRTDQLQLETVKQLFSHLDIELSSFAKRLPFTEQGKEKAEKLLSKSLDLVIGIGIASANRLKELSVDFMATLILKLLSENYRVVMIGAASDQEKANGITQMIRRQLPDNINRLFSACGAFSLDELPQLLTRLSCYIGVDSGITYCMDATDVPVVIITGPTESAEQRPTQVPAIFLKPSHLACCPCTFVYQTTSVCKNKQTPYACIRQISVDQVLAAVGELLGKKAT